MAGILGLGTYLPYHRLDRGSITTAREVGTGRSKGTRSVASFDEDTTTMGFEAARAAMRDANVLPQSLWFATAAPAYMEKTNAAAVHAALGLDSAVPGVDVLGSVRSGAGALRMALKAAEPSLVVLSDIRSGLPGSPDERDSGDGAAALLVTGGPEAGIAELVGTGSATEEFLDRWRVPSEPFARAWEERFGEEVYVPLGEQALTDALKAAGVTADAVDHFVVTGTHGRAVARLRKSAGVRPEAIAEDVAPFVGNTGTAHVGILLAAVLERAQPNQVVVAVVLADGAEAFVFRTTDALAQRRPSSTVADQVAAGRPGLPYTTFLTWRGALDRHRLRRPAPSAPLAPSSHRNEAFKFGLTGSRCRDCSTRHLPPQRVCQGCRAVDRMEPERLADLDATLANATVDRLAWTPNPPSMYGLVDFQGGGRLQCELTDVDPDEVAPGIPVELVFRRVFTVDGVHNYFWKARPSRGKGTR